MPQVMDSNIMQPSPCTRSLPEGLKVAQALSFQLAGNHPRISRNGGSLFQQCNCCLAKVDYSRSRFGIW